MTKDKTKILVLGATGMLGHKLVQRLGRTFDIFGTIRETFDTIEEYGLFDRERIIESIDATDLASLESAIVAIQPDVVINAIGIVKQVPSAKDVITTLEVNSILPHRLAILGQKYGFRLISISTDCVFDGSTGNYSEEDVPNAPDLYGKSKNLGEVTGKNCLTLRTSIIGRELGTSHSLVEWFLSNRGGSVSGFTTAFYSGFPTIVFADIISSLIAENKELSGLYHVASRPINKFDLLSMVNTAYDAGVSLIPSDDLVIDRSLNGSAFARTTGCAPPDWDEMVQMMASDETPYDNFKK